MALALKRLPGETLTVVVTGGGTVTAWDKISLNIEQGTFDASSASATYDQKTTGRKRASGTISGFLGTEGVPPALGDTISAITMSVSTDETGPTTIDDASVYGTLKVTKVNYEYQDSPAKYSFDFESGFIE